MKGTMLSRRKTTNCAIISSVFNPASSSLKANSPSLHPILRSIRGGRDPSSLSNTYPLQQLPWALLMWTFNRQISCKLLAPKRSQTWEVISISTRTRLISVAIRLLKERGWMRIPICGLKWWHNIHLRAQIQVAEPLSLHEVDEGWGCSRMGFTAGWFLVGNLFLRMAVVVT